MGRGLNIRVRAYKEYLKKRAKSLKGHSFKINLTLPSAKDFKEYLDDFHPGLSVANTARDIKLLMTPGPKYDTEFDVLYRMQKVPHAIEEYSESYISNIVKCAFTPEMVDTHLAPASRMLPGNRRPWEPM